MAKKKNTAAASNDQPSSIIPILRSKGRKGKAAPDAEQSVPAEAPAAPTPPESGKKAEKAEKAAKEVKPKKMSCLDAAAKVLADAGHAMTTSEMIEAMARAQLWSSPNGQTPAATLYSAILRELNTKGGESRFTKTERGKFAAK